MGLDIWFREDIENALLAANESCRLTAESVGVGDPLDRAYLKGYRAALSTIALAFGLSPAMFRWARLQLEDGERREEGDVIHLVPDRIRE